MDQIVWVFLGSVVVLGTVKMILDIKKYNGK